MVFIVIMSTYLSSQRNSTKNLALMTCLRCPLVPAPHARTSQSLPFLADHKTTLPSMKTSTKKQTTFSPACLRALTTNPPSTYPPSPIATPPKLRQALSRVPLFPLETPQLLLLLLLCPLEALGENPNPHSQPLWITKRPSHLQRSV